MSGETVVVVAELMAAMRWALGQKKDAPLGGPVGEIQHVAGLLVPIDGFPEQVDEDCDVSVAFVNVLRRFRTESGVFPSEASNVQQCGSERAVLVQIGVARCSVGLNDDGSPPSRARKEHEALVMQDDADRMDTAICRAVHQLDDADAISAYVVHAWEPVGPQGGIVTGTQSISFLLS